MFSPPDDELLDAADDGQPAFVVEHAEVARAQPPAVGYASAV
jgi:hypothetical protein